MSQHDYLRLWREAMTHKNAAIKACEAGDYATSAQQGSQSLILESEWVCQQADISRQVLSFSLYGDEPIYCETALINAQAMPKIYPKWKMWVYHDHSVPEHVLTRLRQHHARLINVHDIGIAYWPGTFWRFHAVTDPQVAKVQFRDADSLINQREAQWVQEWLDSKQPFHVFRDWYSHLDLILAGMWGAHAPYLAHMSEWIEAHLQVRTELHPTHADQIFLAEVIWPRIEPYCLVHDSTHSLPNGAPMHAPAPQFEDYDLLGRRNEAKIAISLKNQGSSVSYWVSIWDEQQQLVMRYLRTLHNGRDTFRLPAEYYRKVESGLWRIQYKPVE